MTVSCYLKCYYYKGLNVLDRGLHKQFQSDLLFFVLKLATHNIYGNTVDQNIELM